MTAHELAHYLLKNCPDLPVEINGWGSAEGNGMEVTGAAIDHAQKVVVLGHGDWRWEGCKYTVWQDWYLTEERLGDPGLQVDHGVPTVEGCMILHVVPGGGPPVPYKRVNGTWQKQVGLS